mmetsp:Transcript_46289/g.124362  ORF Transcript_46289/g.124362 Transcript_46289/m.124362 type:complete len:235 (+) Transcript_46289:548-1252(+)
MTVVMMLSSSLAFLARSEACRSMTSKFSMPIRQPTMTPHTPPNVETRLVTPSRCCASVRPGSGRPSFRQNVSMAPPKVTPQVSLRTCPIAAAASVGRPRQTPTVLSMVSPAQMRTLWSTIPNATNGTAEPTKIRRSCSWVGGGTTPSSGTGSCPLAAAGAACASAENLRSCAWAAHGGAGRTPRPRASGSGVGKRRRRGCRGRTAARNADLIGPEVPTPVWEHRNDRRFGGSSS